MQLALRQPLPAQDQALKQLLGRLLELTRRELPSACFRTRARNAYTLSAVAMDSPVLTLPLQGAKRVREADRWISINPGEIFLVCHAMTRDIENIPDPATSWYTAICIPFPQYILDAARQLLGEPVSGGGESFACVPLDAYLEDLTTWVDAMERGDSPRARHAIVGVALRLYAQGHRGLLHPPPPLLSTRIRAMVAADPTRDWSSADMESNLGMSGATLRRHLAAEGMSLRELIGDARLSQGLSLLMSTRLPIKSVALRVGYASVSSFVKRFRERYGVEPSRVRG